MSIATRLVCDVCAKPISPNSGKRIMVGAGRDLERRRPGLPPEISIWIDGVQIRRFETRIDLCDAACFGGLVAAQGGREESAG